MPDWPAVHQQLKRKGMTKQLLWEEYTCEHPTRCYSYSQYCDRYARWRRLQKRSMRQLHKAGEKVFIDYAGPTVSYLDARTGECKEAQIFKVVKVNIDYHVQYQQHHYSVPHQYVGEKLELHAGNEVVQIYFQTRLIGSHPRKHHAGMTTDAAHMPEAHRQHHQWTPARLKQWANSVGSNTGNWIGYQLDSKEHPEQAYRICLGLLSLSREYPSLRLNAACRIANREGLVRLKQINSILSKRSFQTVLDIQLQI